MLKERSWVSQESILWTASYLHYRIVAEFLLAACHHWTPIYKYWTLALVSDEEVSAVPRK